MSSPANTEIARALLEAYVAKDRAAAERLIAGDFHFTSPLDNRIDRQTYFEICWPTSQTSAAFDLIRLVADGDRVIVTYEGRRTIGKPFRNTEIMAIRDGQVVEVEVYFGWPIPHEAPLGSHIDPR